MKSSNQTPREAPAVTIRGARAKMVLSCDSITVLSTWELTSVSMRCSQGDGVNTSLSRLVYCTHVYCIGGLAFLSCMCVGIFLGTVMCYPRR